jgi:hypothetical protein
MKIYLELIYNNIESFLSTTFPVTRSIYSDANWEKLVREYLHRHQATSPYFLEIPQEFLQFLSEGCNAQADPPWLLELCHYEWVELALDVADLEQSWDLVDPGADLLTSKWVVSPLIWSLSYRYPVHKIGPSNHASIVAEPTYLIVFRDGKDKVRFMESDAPTNRLIDLLADAKTLAEAIERLVIELPHLKGVAVRQMVMATLAKLRAAEILLGPAIA